MSQQGHRQASFRAIGGTEGTHLNDALAAFQAEATIPAGTSFNGAFILWLQERLGSSSTSLNDLLAEWAAAEGATNAGSIGPFDPSAAIYAANAVHFDGTNDYLTRGAALTGAADSKLLTFSFWFRRASDDTLSTVRRLFGDNGATFINLAGTTRRVAIQFENSASAFTAALAIATTVDVLDTNIHHVMCSVDMADTAKRHLFFDGASSLAVTTYTDVALNLDRTDWSVGANTFGTTKYDGDIADFQIWFGAYVDLSQSANRELFIKGGKPADPAVAAAALGDPIIRLSNPTASWHTNVGTGGGFTLNGALTDGQTPVEL